MCNLNVLMPQIRVISFFFLLIEQAALWVERAAAQVTLAANECVEIRCLRHLMVDALN